VSKLSNSSHALVDGTEEVVLGVGSSGAIEEFFTLHASGVPAFIYYLIN
jgi:hypothetical protein